jgi:hypothetical protein
MTVRLVCRRSGCQPKIRLWYVGGFLAQQSTAFQYPKQAARRGSRGAARRRYSSKKRWGASPARIQSGSWSSSSLRDHEFDASGRTADVSHPRRGTPSVKAATETLMAFSLELTPAQQDLVERTHRFAEEVVRPVAERYMRWRRFAGISRPTGANSRVRENRGVAGRFRPSPFRRSPAHGGLFRPIFGAGKMDLRVCAVLHRVADAARSPRRLQPEPEWDVDHQQARNLAIDVGARERPLRVGFRKSIPRSACSARRLAAAHSSPRAALFTPFWRYTFRYQ